MSRRDVIGSDRRVDRILFDVVVRVRFEAVAGSRSDMRFSTSPTVDEDGTGRESVEGSPKPGKVVRRTLIIWGAILFFFVVMWRVDWGL